LEALLEECHIKLSSLVSDLLGVSARRMVQALADGETDPAALAALANYHLRATQETVARRTRRLPGAQSRTPLAHRHARILRTIPVDHTIFCFRYPDLHHRLLGPVSSLIARQMRCTRFLDRTVPK
jgi:transposase